PSARLAILTTSVTLFFIQLITIWIESTYRISLIKTSMGYEIFGLLFVFFPIMLFFTTRKSEGILFNSALTLVIATRLLCDVAGASASIVIAGLGVGAGLVLLCFVFSSGYAYLRSTLPAGILLGLFLSILFRACGSSYDITFGGRGVLISWLLAIIFVWLALRFDGAPDEAGIEEGSGSVFAAVVRCIGWFANVAIIYIVLSSPAVVSAWSNTSYLVNVICICGSWTLAAFLLKLSGCRVMRIPLFIWNLLFSGTLIAGVCLHSVVFPATPESPAVIVPPPTMAIQIFFYAMLVLSPVVLANMLHLLQQPLLSSPRTMIAPVIIGALTLLSIIMQSIFTNVWGYVGDIGAFYRNKFYFPFLVAAVAMLLPYAVTQRSPRPLRSFGPATVVVACILSLLSIIAVAVRGWPKVDPGTAHQLTILTYNIQLGSEEQGDRNYRDQLAFIKRVNPDIIGLQESDSARPGGGNVDVARYFAESLGYFHYFGPSTITGTFGTAIISRYPLQNPRTIFSYSDKDETGTAVAEIEVAGTRIALINSHPAGSDANFQGQANALVEAAAPYEHVIATGDYNSRPGSDHYKTVTTRLKDSWRSLYPDGIGRRHPNIGHNRRDPETIDMSAPIDHIFLTPNLKVGEAFYIPAPASETDHPAYWTTVTWEG
ncbi:MAG: endonuclease/exonuclease/phosphatase family protein, partial [Candidatus Hydrogenedentes bacterium]|nr:endonuclease/exonuclease/phosphatase family protein [Candidatus Hydrogenedentota bacterium]